MYPFLKAISSHISWNAIHRVSSETLGVLAKVEFLSSVLGHEESQEPALSNSFKGDFYAYKRLDLSKGQLLISAPLGGHSIFLVSEVFAHATLPVEPLLFPIRMLVAYKVPLLCSCCLLEMLPLLENLLGFLGMFSPPSLRASYPTSWSPVLWMVISMPFPHRRPPSKAGPMPRSKVSVVLC